MADNSGGTGGEGESRSGSGATATEAMANKDRGGAWSPRYLSPRPSTRWWWFNQPISEEDISSQLEWMASVGIGGVELAFIYPLNYTTGPALRSPEWTALLVHAKREATRLGLHLDMTFGSLWPFGGSWVADADAARTFDGFYHRSLSRSWEDGDHHVLNHLSAPALDRYAAGLMPSMLPAIEAGAEDGALPTALFCDSWEVHDTQAWDPALWDEFADCFGYRLEEHALRPIGPGKAVISRSALKFPPGVAYDYWRLLFTVVTREFYAHFTDLCHQAGALSRVQCHGSPTDLLSSYAAVDIPETEALLFPVRFTQIPASAAALAAKPIVSSETFTCLYGFQPAHHFHNELVADLKLLADGLFACGMNHVFYHGTPFNPPGGDQSFYAATHIGPDAVFADELPAFNAYMATVSAWMRRGVTASCVAVYLPVEDEIYKGRLEGELQTPGSLFHHEMRYVRHSSDLHGYHPVWISEPWLEDAQADADGGGGFTAGACHFRALVIDAERVHINVMRAVVKLAAAGVRVVMGRIPKEPGHITHDQEYEALVAALVGCPLSISEVEGLAPMVALRPASADEASGEAVASGSGDSQGDTKAGDEPSELPLYWARWHSGEAEGEANAGDSFRQLAIFVAHPLASHISFPMVWGESLTDRSVTWQCDLTLHESNGGARVAATSLELVFDPQQSILLNCVVDWEAGTVDVETIDIEYLPPRDHGRPPSPEFKGW